jgi:TonB family protein
MNAILALNNLGAYVLQIGLFVGIGATVPLALRLKVPRVRLHYWQLLLAACLALPWVRPWHSEVIAVSSAPFAAALAVTSVGGGASVAPAFPPFAVIALWLLVAGVAIRLVWLAMGMLKLARYRRHGRGIPMPAEWTGAAGHATLLLSDEVDGPVTFGFFRPVVLLPAGFPSMPEAMRDAILFHELLHVVRRDWLFTFGEELVRAVFWFHPAIWWVLGEIQLAREQTVDHAVIEMTQARDPYVDTLLTMARVNAQLDLAPAPLFLRRRHLKQRVMGIVREVTMSKTRLILSQSAALAAMALACWVITGAIPLEAQAQLVIDAPGVTVNLNGSQLMHRPPVAYPAATLEKGVEGTVVVQVRLDATGEVIDDAILSGPDELRKSVQQSVLSWHFDRSAALSTRVVNIDFVRPVGTPVGIAPPVVDDASLQRAKAELKAAAEQRASLQALVSPTDPASSEKAAQMDARVVELQQAYNSQLRQSATAALEALARSQQELQQPPRGAILDHIVGPSIRPSFGPLQQPTQTGRIERIDIVGLSDDAEKQLLAQLPVRVGDPYSDETWSQAVEAAHKFDEHLTISIVGETSSGGRVLRIATRGLGMLNVDDPLTPIRVPPANMPGAVAFQTANLISAAKPIYPPLAKMARQQGTVRFEATVGKDGSVENLKVVSGPPLLVQAAQDAVKQWVYRPTLVNGVPVEVVTTVDVNFSLADGAAAAPPQ